MQFIALRTGVHVIDALTLRDIESDAVTDLRSVMNVVVLEMSTED